MKIDMLSSAMGAKSVTPNDSSDLPDGRCKALYIGSAGNVKVTTAGKDTVTWMSVPDAGYVLCQIVRVWDTDTTATNILALY